MRLVKKGVPAVVLSMIFMLACALSVFADTAIVTTSDGSSVNMRSEATTDSTVVNFLADGTEVEVLGTDGDWTQVSYDGYVGYVMSTYLTAVTDDTTADTAADTTVEETQDTAAEAAEDEVSEDTASEESSEDAEEAEEEEEEDTSESSSDSEKLAKYKKLVMILGMVCLVLVIIIINLLLFYRRDYDDDEYDDEDEEDEEDEEEDERYERRSRRSSSRSRKEEPQEAPRRETSRETQSARDIDVPDISQLVNDTTAEVYGEKSSPSKRAAQQESPNYLDDDEDLEFFDLDDL